jgi:hypothetical protein
MIHLHGIRFPSHHESSINGGDDRVHRGYQVKLCHPLPNFEHDQDLTVRPIVYIQGIDKFDLAQ